jgi:hypothetical protein
MNTARRSQPQDTSLRDRSVPYRVLVPAPPSALASALPACPRCASDALERLRSMQQYSRDHWFRCEVCQHLFTAAFDSARF